MICFNNDENWKKTCENIMEMSQIPAALWQVLKELWDELDYMNFPFRITAVYYPPGAFGSKSLTHPELRAVDVGARDRFGDVVDLEMGRMIENRVNNRFTHFGMRAVVFHKGRTEWHFHCQVPRSARNGYSITVEEDG